MIAVSNVDVARLQFAMTSRVPKNRVSRRYSGLRRRYQAVCSIAVSRASPIVTGTKKKWLTVTNPNCHRARSTVLMLPPNQPLNLHM